MKKILSLILALIMMLSTATMIFADEAITDEAPVEVDETTSAYYEAVKFLVNYDIMHGKGDTLGVFDDVKRYEAALFFGRILTGWTDDSTWEDGILNSSEFTDLAGTAAEAFYGAISYVNQMGVIEGYGDGKFGPEDGIRYQDLLAMAVRALGYSEKYPWGCIQKAVELGLTDGITGVAYTDTLKREVVAQVIYNTLFAEKKAGGTLAKDVFDLDLAWTTVIITGTDKTTGVPTGYVSYSIVNADGSIGSDTFYAPAEQFGLTGEHDDEKAYAALYNVMFETTAEFGLNNVIAAESLELDTVVNEGIYSKTLAGYPIQVFLANYDIVTRYTAKTYLNAEPEIIIASVGLGLMDEWYVDGEYAIDWATGNILYRDFSATETIYYLWFSEYHQYGENAGTFPADPTKEKFGLNEYAESIGLPMNNGYCISRIGYADIAWDTRYICPDCGKWFDQHTEITDCLIKNACDRKVSYTPTEVLWYYNALIDAYFQVQFNDGRDEIGVTYMTEDYREYFFNNVINKTVYADWEEINTVDKIESDAAKLNAYASLRTFDADKDSVADYGIYEEYRFGVVNTGMVVCEGKDCDGTPRAGYIFSDLSNYPVGGTVKVALEVIAETSCKHGTAWTEDEIVDGSYVIYGYNPATGETKIIKTIAGAKEYDDDADYVGTGYLRAFDATKSTLTIDGEDYQYDYSNLKGSMTTVMNYMHGYDENDTDRLESTNNHFNAPEMNKFLAVAARYLRTLYNQVVEFVVVDDKIVHIELSGASDDVIVVESYAGLHEDGTIVVWGYLVGASQTATKLQQFRINSYNSWLMGDWYNYSWNYTDVIEAAFTTGTVYQIKSYDEELKAYNVQVLSSMTDNEYDYTKGGIWTELYYGHCGINWMAKGDENGYLSNARANASSAAQNGGKDYDITQPHHMYFRKMADTDKYVFIYDVNKSGTVAPIVTYTGKVTDPNWFAKGWRVDAGVDGTYVMVIDGEYSDGTKAEVRGFGGAVDQGIGAVLFLEYGTKAAFDAENGRDYLVGSTVYTVHALDLVTGKFVEVVAYNGALRSPTITWTDAKTGYEGATTNYVEWELGTEYAILLNEDGTRHTMPVSPWDYNEGYNWVWESEFVATENGAFFAKEGSMLDGYVDNSAVHYAYVSNTKGYIYKTVNGVIVNDEPLTAAEAGKLLGDIVAKDASIATADFVGETGYVPARINGSNCNEYQMLGNGFGGSYENAIGFNQYAINMRLTYNAFGVCYIGLSPYTLTRDNGRVVRVYALRDAEKGRVEVKLVAANKANKVNSTDPFGNFMAQGDTAWGADADCGKNAMEWFSDTADNQLYNYTMIYNCDRSNTTLDKSKDMSYCLVYIYDSNAAELQPEGEFDAGDFDWINK